MGNILKSLLIILIMLSISCGCLEDESDLKDIDESVDIYYNNPDISFYISMEDYYYKSGEPINVTFNILNNENKSVIISALWLPATIRLSLVNKDGKNFNQSWAIAIPWLHLNGIEINKKENYSKFYDIRYQFGFDKYNNETYFFWSYLDIYFLKAIYVNFHSFENQIDTNNFTKYYSNEIEFEVV